LEKQKIAETHLKQPKIHTILWILNI
jgi:hypothetical protein